MTFNNELLGRLVTWAAGDQLSHHNPQAAQALGLIKDADSPRWKQNSWGQAERNGVCQTAFCIAGHAVAMDENLVMIMNVTSEIERDGKTYRTYHTDRVVKKDALEEGTLPDFATTDEKVKGFVWLDRGWTDNEFLSQMFGPEWYYADDKTADVQSAAEGSLGISSTEGDALFRGSNEIGDVVAIAHIIAANHDATLDVPAWVTEHYYDEDTVRMYEFLAYASV